MESLLEGPTPLKAPIHEATAGWATASDLCKQAAGKAAPTAFMNLRLTDAAAGRSTEPASSSQRQRGAGVKPAEVQSSWKHVMGFLRQPEALNTAGAAADPPSASTSAAAAVMAAKKPPTLPAIRVRPGSSMKKTGPVPASTARAPPVPKFLPTAPATAASTGTAYPPGVAAAAAPAAKVPLPGGKPVLKRKQPAGGGPKAAAAPAAKRAATKAGAPNAKAAKQHDAASRVPKPAVLPTGAAAAHAAEALGEAPGGPAAAVAAALPAAPHPPASEGAAAGAACGAAATKKDAGAAPKRERTKASDLDYAVVAQKVEARVAAGAGSLKDVSVAELKCYLKANKLPVGGKKADLEARLAAHLASRPAAAP
jgi:hypothetical protein